MASVSHIGIPVGSHYAEMRDFYKGILASIGYELFFEGPAGMDFCGFGPKGGNPDFWIGGGAKDDRLPKYGGKLEERIAPVHVAFWVDTEKQVTEWHEAAMKFGAKDNGPPGERPQYRPGYYAAFVLDPLGNNIEVHKRFSS